MQTRTLGIVIAIIGLLMMVYTGFNYITTKKVADLGSVEITKDESHPVRWSPVVGAILLFGGLVVIITNKNK